MPNRDTWTPGSLIPGIALTAQVVLLAIAMVRGLDYGTGESAETARRLGAVEMAAPMWMWGLSFTVAASLVFAAMAWRWAAGVIIGHTALAGLYGAIGVGIVPDVWERTQLHGGGGPTFALTIPIIATIAVIWGAKRHPHELMHTVVTGVCVALVVGAFTICLDGLRNTTILTGIAALHALIAIGTAQTTAQDTIRRGRGETWTQQQTNS